MSDNLEVVNGKRSMFYYGDKPWHGYGKKVNRALTAQEALEEANLNYEVAKRKIFIETGDEVKGKWATYRMDKEGSDSILGVVGDRYNVIQNADMFSFFDPLVERSEALYHTAGVLGKGEQMWLLAKLPESMRIGNDDIIDKYIMLTNCHDGYGSAVIKLTTVRVVCENTLNLALGQAGKHYRIRHTGSAQDKIKEAYKVLGITQNYFKLIEMQIQQMSAIDITDQQLKDYVSRLVITTKEEKPTILQTKKVDKICELASTGKGAEMSEGTLWGAFNAVTEYIDHHTNPKNYIDNIWFGTGNEFKSKAWNNALTYLN